MTISGAALSQALNSLDASVGSGLTNYMGFVSQHTAAPNASGSNEKSGTTRQAAAWSASSAGSAKTNTGALTLTNDGTVPITDLGTWTLVSGGVFGVVLHLTSPVQATSIAVAIGALSESGS